MQRYIVRGINLILAKKKKSHLSGSWEAGWWSNCTRQLLLFVNFIFFSCISHLYFCICILYLCISTFPVHGRQDGGAAAKVAGVPIAGQEKQPGRVWSRRSVWKDLSFKILLCVMCSRIQFLLILTCFFALVLECSVELLYLNFYCFKKPSMFVAFIGQIFASPREEIYVFLRSRNKHLSAPERRFLLSYLNLILI